MGLIGHRSISDRSTIAHIKKSEAKFRDMIKIEMGIGSDDGTAARVQVAKASSSVPTDLSEYKDKEYYVSGPRRKRESYLHVLSTQGMHEKELHVCPCVLEMP